MPAAVTDFGAPAWLAALFGIDAVPTGYHLGLVSEEPGIGTDGVILADLEPAGAGYARQAYGSGSSWWVVNGNDVLSVQAVDFGIAAADWGPLNHFALCTDATDGDVWAYGELSDPLFVEADYHLIIPAGGLVLSLVSLDDSIAI